MEVRRKFTVRMFTLLFAAIQYIRLGCAQAVDPDNINFSALPIYKDLRSCLQYELNIIGYNVGCKTNNCLCRGSTQGQAIGVLADRVLAGCSNLDDESSATSILTSYCGMKGYTAIVSPTVLLTGASTVTVTTNGYGGYCGATATVTRYVAAGVPGKKLPDAQYVSFGVVATAMLTFMSSLWVIISTWVLMNCGCIRRNNQGGSDRFVTADINRKDGHSFDDEHKVN